MAAPTPHEIRDLERRFDDDAMLLDPSRRGLYLLLKGAAGVVTGVAVGGLMSVIPLVGFFLIAAVMIGLGVGEGLAMLTAFAFLSACVPIGFFGVPSLHRRAKGALLRWGIRSVERSLQASSVAGVLTPAATRAGDDTDSKR
jgi:hypothetical protein